MLFICSHYVAKAAAGGEIAPQKLVEIAVETAQFGMPAKFQFPAAGLVVN